MTARLPRRATALALVLGSALMLQGCLVGAVSVVFDEGEEGVAPGQACALYDPADPDRLLGGGFITTTSAVAD